MSENGITFEQVKELYIEMKSEISKQKYREYERNWRRQRYHDDPEFREKCRQRAILSYYNRKQAKSLPSTI
jgi:hypothetical protein